MAASVAAAATTVSFMLCQLAVQPVRGSVDGKMNLNPAPPAPPITLEAADGVALKIEFPQGARTSALEYSVSLDGEAWLKSGPVAMTSGGVTYTTECSGKDGCLSLSAPPTKSSGTDVSTHASSVHTITRLSGFL